MFTKECLGKLSEFSLEDICSANGLLQNGTKAVLLDRILNAGPPLLPPSLSAFPLLLPCVHFGFVDLNEASCSGTRKRHIDEVQAICSGGALIFAGPQSSIPLTDGAEVVIGSRTWKASCSKDALRLTCVTLTNDRRRRRGYLIGGTQTELARRRQELTDLRAVQNQLLDQVEEGGEGEFESQNQQLKCITLARKGHRARIEELQIMLASEVGVELNFTRAHMSTGVWFPAGELRASVEVAVDGGDVAAGTGLGASSGG